MVSRSFNNGARVEQPDFLSVILSTHKPSVCYIAKAAAQRERGCSRRLVWTLKLRQSHRAQ